METSSEFETFLVKLEKEAALQAKLHRTKVLPQQLDWITSVIGKYSWQTFLFLSGMTALAAQLVKAL